MAEMDGTIKVQAMESFSAQITKISNDLDAIKKAAQEADDAANMAIAGAGGAATEVGKAIDEACAQINTDEFKKTVESLESFIAGTKHISQSYVQARMDMIEAINKAKSEGAEVA